MERQSVELTNDELEVHLEELGERKERKFECTNKISRKKVGLVAIAMIGMIVVLGMISGGFTGGILTGEAVAPVTLVENDGDHKGPMISWYSNYVDYKNYKYIYRDTGDPIIDRSDESLQKNLIESTNYKVQLSPSDFTNRLDAISANFKEIQGIYKLHHSSVIGSKVESQEIIEYDVASSCFTSNSGGDRSQIQFSTIHLIADGITTEATAEAKIQNATAHVSGSNNEKMKAECLRYPLISDDLYSPYSQRLISLGSFSFPSSPLHTSPPTSYTSSSSSSEVIIIIFHLN
jgi:hypothetical protein